MITNLNNLSKGRRLELYYDIKKYSTSLFLFIDNI